MITPSTIYWITRLDSINRVLCFINCLVFIAVIAFAILAVILICKGKDYSSDSEDRIRAINNVGWRMLKRLSIPASAFLLIASVLAFIPTTKEAAAMYVIPAVVNNEQLRDTGNKIFELASEWLEELRPCKKNNKEN